MAGGAWGLEPTVFAFERSFNHASPAAFPEACQPGLLLSLNRLLDLTSLAKGYASALRVIAEP